VVSADINELCRSYESALQAALHTETEVPVSN
jgi:hypothetical protein